MQPRKTREKSCSLEQKKNIFFSVAQEKLVQKEMILSTIQKTVSRSGKLSRYRSQGKKEKLAEQQEMFQRWMHRRLLEDQKMP